ncbi:uncharacterized protein LOC115319662 [Ixodes scapularis]|uniref:uncharacterized protein LOC115319662 n=1 Tax=Ixodes scapularis TaxID=6945 RepID=UPI001A9D3A56|nr:uncharacterized protein LOC115319662 [Ixodes scapularis]
MSLMAFPSFLPALGKPAILWKQWQRVFNNYLLAMGGNAHEHARQKALLLHCLWVRGQRIFYSLPETRPQILGLREPPEGQKTPTALDKYDVALAALSSCFAATPNLFDARHRFGQQVQLRGESIDRLFAELRDLSSNCEFGAMVDDFIQDQLVAKTSIQQLRERLLLEGTCLTPDSALVIGCLVEETVRYSKELVSDSAMPKVDAKPMRSADQPRIHGKVSLRPPLERSSTILGRQDILRISVHIRQEGKHALPSENSGIFVLSA